MEFLPTTLGTRPRLAVELRAEGVVAACAEDAAALLVAVSRASLPEGAIVTGLKTTNVADRAAVVAALRKTLEAVAEKASGRGRVVTLIVPDAAVRVLLLDFDSLPSKFVEALPVVRFRLKKMLPFEAEDAAVSYQVMSSGKSGVRVVAVAMPREVLIEYESVVREAGFEPGAVLPSTLAALAGLDATDAPTLVVNVGPKGVTTAIVRGGMLLLHRSVDMTTEEPYVEPVVSLAASLPLVDHESSIEEWALQQPVGIGMTAEAEAARVAAIAEPNAVLEGVREELRELANTSGAQEVSQAVSVAAAYFEDTLGFAPTTILAAGTTGAARLGQMLRDAGFGGEAIQVREIVEPAMITTPSAEVPRGWLAGVRGALKS
jgi:type IV pilus assembly protein PilM